MDKYLNKESIIPVFSIKEKQILNNIYNIHNWNDTLNYFRNYNKNNLKYGFDRILKFSWIVFLNDYKNNLNTIFEIYKIYTNVKKIRINENELKKIIKDIDINKYDVKNIYEKLLE